MITGPKIMIISLVCTISMEVYFYDVFGEILLHTKILIADLKFGFYVSDSYYLGISPTAIYEAMIWLQKLYIHEPIYLLYNLQKESRRSVEKYLDNCILYR
jgi:hypothetical protein